MSDEIPPPPPLQVIPPEALVRLQLAQAEIEKAELLRELRIKEQTLIAAMIERDTGVRFAGHTLQGDGTLVPNPKPPIQGPQT